MQVSLRKMVREDIPLKVKWINDEKNNQFLHYTLPLEYEKTIQWFDRVKNLDTRYDGIIEADGVAVGLIGLLSIENEAAEYYITMGEQEYKGRGLAKKASYKLLRYAFEELGLKKVYLYTECDNVMAQKLFERIGFRKCGVEKGKIENRGKKVDRFYYEITRKDFYEEKKNAFKTTVYLLEEQENHIYIKRDDYIPISFGGNKARKAINFFEEIDKGQYNVVVTYGSSSSNHCRIIANMAASRKLPCYIIGPQEASEPTTNSKMMELFGAQITVVPVEEVRDTIEKKVQDLRKKGYTPYFIAGGGHGNLGTQAYVDCYKEIKEYEIENNIHFDYIFHACGTGTTQAGLVCGQLMEDDERKIIGISIARKNPRGREVVLESIRDYFAEKEVFADETKVQKNTIFVDQYIGNGYGSENEKVKDTIKEMLIRYGIPMDSTYVGKAYWGMKEYIKEKNIIGKNILFIHTGGTPLFFDDLKEF